MAHLPNISLLKKEAKLLSKQSGLKYHQALDLVTKNWVGVEFKKSLEVLDESKIQDLKTVLKSYVEFLLSEVPKVYENYNSDTDIKLVEKILTEIVLENTHKLSSKSDFITQTLLELFKARNLDRYILKEILLTYLINSITENGNIEKHMNSKINVPKLIDSVLNLFEFRLFKEKIHISKYYDNINVVVRDDESLIKFNLINIFNKILELKICSVSIYNTYNEDKCEIEIIVYNDKSSIENFNLNLKNVTIKIIDNGVHSIVLSIENNLLSLTNSKSIALIDDNYDFSRLMNYMMKDYPIKKFYSKPDLVDIFMSEYDVYLIDFHLGQCFGLELILLLKELDPSARYILVTADKNASIPENIEVIYKPIKKVDIDRIVRESDIVKR